MFGWSGSRTEAVARAHEGRRAGKGRMANGQSLAEFALVLPVMVAIIGGIIQFGMIFWAQNTLTQVVRDTGRWAATQQSCVVGTGLGQVDIAGEARLVANNSSLLGYPPTPDWTTATDVGSDAGFASFTGEGVAVAWVREADPGSKGCPPQNNQAVYHVTIKINHSVPTFFPGMQYLPGLGTCSGGTCRIVLSSTAQFRMEPAP